MIYIDQVIKGKTNTVSMAGNNVKIIDYPCKGVSVSLSPRTAQYSPLLNDDQEMSSSTMKN